jgi:hypothetical protein
MSLQDMAGPGLLLFTRVFWHRLRTETGRKPGSPFVCIPGPIATNYSPTDTCAISQNLYKILAFSIAMCTRGNHILSHVLSAWRQKRCQEPYIAKGS